jgi:ADP-L-glycero-D-manno-heptose 6-epimerase
MIIVTGGAGFIGSAIIWKLNERGISDILVVDHLGTSEKWKNLVNLRFNDYMDRDLFLKKLETGEFDNSIDAIIHMGACSATTEKNADYLMENNFHYTVRLAQWAVSKKCRFIYASSAATYGSGELGYSDTHEKMEHLKPLNMYGYSKHLFDKYAFRMGWLDRIAGLKFFNVFGPNEYHKGEMSSIVCKSYRLIRDEGRISLFKSHQDKYCNGGQIRDFIYVKDVVEMVLYFFDNRDIGGIYNIGTGLGHTWNELAHAMFSACQKEPNINYIDMPENLREKYQYFTKAEMEKLGNSGCLHVCQTLENAVDDYVNNYLKYDRYLGE